MDKKNYKFNQFNLNKYFYMCKIGMVINFFNVFFVLDVICNIKMFSFIIIYVMFMYFFKFDVKFDVGFIYYFFSIEG